MESTNKEVNRKRGRLSNNGFLNKDLAWLLRMYFMSYLAFVVNIRLSKIKRLLSA